jgi:hypothetical protein
MLYEVSSRRIAIDKRGNDKAITEHFLVNDTELFAEAESAVLDIYNGENDVIAVKRSAVSEVINKRTEDEQKIFVANIERSDIEGKVTKVSVALFANNITEANKISHDYIAKAVVDETVVEVKKSKFLDLI